MNKSYVGNLSREICLDENCAVKYEIVNCCLQDKVTSYKVASFIMNTLPTVQFIRQLLAGFVIGECQNLNVFVILQLQRYM